MMKGNIALFVLSVLIFGVLIVWQFKSRYKISQPDNLPNLFSASNLSIAALRNSTYPGSDLKIEQTLSPGINYSRYIVSYKSEGLKIYALLTVPQESLDINQKQPIDSKKWPVIVFNHGYIPPKEYKTAERYVAYSDAFSRNGYIVLKPDYRGHGDSEGEAVGGYGSNAYTIDVLNAVSSLKKFKFADPNRIGMWGHSMGGFITLRVMVVRKDIKAGVIWSGVVAPYQDLLFNWRSNKTALITPTSHPEAAKWRKILVSQFGDPKKNPIFWNSISSNAFLKDISGPIQLHHAAGDEAVPVKFSQDLYKQLKAIGKNAEYFEYPGDNHNLSGNFEIAMQSSLDFFDKYVKGK